MILLGNFLIAVGKTLEWVLWLYNFLLIAHVICSWVRADPRSFLVQIIYGSTEPLLSRIRRKVPPLGMLDMSIIVAFVMLIFLNFFVVTSLVDYGNKLRFESLRPTSIESTSIM